MLWSLLSRSDSIWDHRKWQEKKQSVMFAWLSVFFKEMNYIVVYIEWIYFANKAKIRHWNTVRTFWGMILRLINTSRMLNFFHCCHWNSYYSFEPRKKLSETMPWESFVFCFTNCQQQQKNGFIGQFCLVPK